MTDETRDVEARLREVLLTAAPTPPREVDPADVRLRSAAPGRRRLPRPSVPVLAAAAVLALVVGLWSLAVTRNHDGSHDGPADAGVARLPAPAVPTTDPTSGSPRQRTIAAADRVLAAMPVVPGAHVVTSGPPLALTGARQPSTIASSNDVDRSVVRVGRGDVAEAMAYVDSHLPDGFTGTPDGPDSVGYTLDARWQDPATYSSMFVEVTYARAGASVGIRVDVRAAWLPARTARQMIGSVTGLSLSYAPYAHGAPLPGPRIHRSLDRSAAQHLADLVDDLSVKPPGGTFTCPSPQPARYRAVLVFHGDTDRRVVYELVCAEVRIAGGPPLSIDDEFLAAYHRAIGGD